MDPRGRGTVVPLRRDPPNEEPPLKADPHALLALLDLQQIDSRILQLRHQKASLPELKEISALRATRKQVEDQARDARIRRDDLELARQKADKDVESVRQRRDRDRQRMDSGAVGSAKDLERMQHELDNLERRISVLEDEELEIMEQLEEAQAVVTELEEKVAAHDERLAELQQRAGERGSEIDADLATATSEREKAVEGLPADLVALYDKLRESKGGVGAAELRARQCGGCMLTLDAVELNRIKALPMDEVVRCEECSRILVRTKESGL